MCEAIITVGCNLTGVCKQKNGLGVEEGRFLGHIIDAKGIRANPKKIQAVLDMIPPNNLKELQSLNGKLVTLSGSLSRASEKQLPFFKVLIECNKKKMSSINVETCWLWGDLKNNFSSSSFTYT
ncbi:hypothetical protein CTI12_AA203250 [Artemisia annua]|uniref:Uncharacterized protein n=1 Tax=Artemisia annua TaxID=35608 RepID=A0A2U1P1Z8_ARTAN|nr:hypothetical protein CTI12_AA203250 [Artemisia annua]